MDERLSKANQIAMQSGHITPLIKEELWTMIQHRRMSNGLQEIEVEFSPKQPMPVLSPEEQERVLKRKLLNRDAGSRCRKRKKESSLEEEKKYTEICERNNELKTRVQSLEEQVQHYNMQLHKMGIFVPASPIFSITDGLSTSPSCTITQPTATATAATRPPSSTATRSGDDVDVATMMCSGGDETLSPACIENDAFAAVVFDGDVAKSENICMTPCVEANFFIPPPPTTPTPPPPPYPGLPPPYLQKANSDILPEEIDFLYEMDHEVPV